MIARKKRLFIFTNCALALYCGAIILFSFETGTTHYAKVISLLLLILAMYYKLAKGMKLIVPVPFKLLFVWLTIAVISSLTAIDVKIAIKLLITMTTLIGVAFIIFNLLIYMGSTKSYQVILVVMTMLSVMIVLRDISAYSNLGRVFGTVGNANSFAFLLIAVITICFSIVLFERKIIYKLIFLAGMLVCVYMMLKTGSRKGMVGLVLAPALVYFTWAQSAFSVYKAKVMSVGAIGVILVIIVIGYITTSEHYDRMEVFLTGLTTGEVGEDDASVSHRMELYNQAFNAAMDNIILGVGPNNLRKIEYGSGLFDSELGAYSHSNYMEILATTGIFGFIFYFSIYAYLYTAFFKLRRCVLHKYYTQRYTAVFTIFIIISIYDVAMVSYAHKITWLVMPLIFAEQYLIQQDYRKKLGMG